MAPAFHAALIPLVLASAHPGPAANPDLPPLQEPNRTALVELLAASTDGVGPDADPAPADFARLLADPAAAQGERVALRARYAGRQRAADAGGTPLTEWGLVATLGGEDLPLVVYLPRRSVAPPPRGAEVAGVARFLTVWADADADGNPRRYPVLVARDLVELAPAAAGRAGWIPGLTALVVALTGVAWFLARRVRRRTPPIARTRVPRAHVRSEAEGFSGVETGPADPAEALARLADESPLTPGRGDPQ